MKKIFAVLMIFSVLLLTGCNFLNNEETENIEVDYTNYINISTIDDLKEMDINKSYELSQDIDLNGEEWVPIGSFNEPFRGHFNGNGYTISNFNITKNNSGYNGLFGYVEGDIENLSVVGFNIDIETDFLANVGGLVGLSYGSITNVTVDGMIEVSSPQANVYAGLLVGNTFTSLQELVIANEFKPVSISNNHVTGSIQIVGSELTYVGGLIGKAQNIEVYDNEVVDVDIQVSSELSTYVGGVIGHNFLYDIENTDESLSVNKDLVYRNIAKVNFIVSSTTDLSLGGIVGYNQNVNIFDNFALINLDVAATRYQVGLVVGENWILNLGKNLSVLESETFSNNSGVYSSLIGEDYSDTYEEDGLYASYVSTDYVLQGTEVNTTNLIQVSFYEGQFVDLERAFIDIIIQLLFTE